MAAMCNCLYGYHDPRCCVYKARHPEVAYVPTAWWSIYPPPIYLPEFQNITVTTTTTTTTPAPVEEYEENDSRVC